MTIVVDIEELIHNSRKSLRASELCVADEILRDPAFAASASTTEIARRAEVSPASVTRLCHGLGFAGVKELKICLAQNAMIGSQTWSANTDGVGTLEGLVDMVSNMLKHSLGNLENDISMPNLIKAVRTLRNSRHICVFPTDVHSACLAEAAYQRLLGLGIHVSQHNSLEAQRATIASADEQTGFLVLALKADSSALVSLMEQLSDWTGGTIVVSPLIAQTQNTSHAYFPLRSQSENNFSGGTTQLFRALGIMEAIASATATGSIDHMSASDNTNWNRPTPKKPR